MTFRERVAGCQDCCKRPTVKCWNDNCDDICIWLNKHGHNLDSRETTQQSLDSTTTETSTPQIYWLPSILPVIITLIIVVILALILIVALCCLIKYRYTTVKKLLRSCLLCKVDGNRRLTGDREGSEPAPAVDSTANTPLFNVENENNDNYMIEAHSSEGDRDCANPLIERNKEIRDRGAAANQKSRTGSGGGEKAERRLDSGRKVRERGKRHDNSGRQSEQDSASIQTTNKPTTSNGSSQDHQQQRHESAPRRNSGARAGNHDDAMRNTSQKDSRADEQDESHIGKTNTTQDHSKSHHVGNNEPVPKSESGARSVNHADATTSTSPCVQADKTDESVSAKKSTKESCHMYRRPNENITPPTNCEAQTGEMEHPHEFSELPKYSCNPKTCLLTEADLDSDTPVKQVDVGDPRSVCLHSNPQRPGEQGTRSGQRSPSVTGTIPNHCLEVMERECQNHPSIKSDLVKNKSVPGDNVNEVSRRQVAMPSVDPQLSQVSATAFPNQVTGADTQSSCRFQKNKSIYQKLGTINWVMDYYSEGESIEVYVNLGSLDPHVVEQQLADITGADITKFHVKQDQQPEEDYNL